MRDSTRVPHLFLTYTQEMIDKNTVKTIVEEWLADKEYFLVDVPTTTSQ